MQCWLCKRRPATLKILHRFLRISLNSKCQCLRQIPLKVRLWLYHRPTRMR